MTKEETLKRNNIYKLNFKKPKTKSKDYPAKGKSMGHTKNTTVAISHGICKIMKNISFKITTR